MINRRIFSGLGIFALGFVLGAVFFLNLGAIRGQEPVVMDFTVVEHASTDAVTDTGEEGDTVGDVLTFANEVYDEVDATMVGADQGYCIRVAVGVSWECNWTLNLESGAITVEGPFFDASESTLAVTGGTGVFANATGTMILRAHDETGTSYDFIYHISVHNEHE